MKQSERARALAQAKADKRKLILLSVGLVLVVAAFFLSRDRSRRYAEERGAELPGPSEPVTERVEVPEIDAAALDALVSDAAPADRVLLEQEAVDRLLSTARNLGPAHFEALGTETLDAGTAEELLAEPSAHRGEAFTARGWVASLRARGGAGARERTYHGQLLTEDDASVYFVVHELAEGVEEQDFVRLDGLFLKAFNDESRQDPGEWIQGPLLVGPRLVPSYTSVGTVESLPRAALLDVTDDDVRGGITGLPHRALWSLLAFVRDAPEGAIDWESAPELDRLVVGDMLQNGEKWRGKPFRLPPSQVMAAWTRRPGENPARMEVVTEGWIGNWNWTGEAKVLRFALPGAHPELEEGTKVTGRGLFLKNYAYEPTNGGMRLSSMVVMDRLDIFDPPEDRAIDQLWLVVTIMAVLLGVGLFLLARRDARRSRRVQESLVRRRRERRRRSDEAGSPSPAPPSPPGS